MSTAIGTQSIIHPKRRASCGSRSTLGLIVRACLAILLAIGFAATATAQTGAPPNLMLPSAIAFDAQGNLFIADANGHIVRELAVSGALTIAAGQGTQGFSGDNGLATAAQLDSPGGLATDAAGNLYIADSHNHRIRKVLATTGVITTIAGTGSPGFSGDGGPAISAAIDLPTALALDSAGNLYFADTNNHRIRRVAASTSIIDTVAGSGIQGYTGDNGPAISAAIDSPAGISLDATGNLYLSDTHNGRVRKINATSGIITTVADGIPSPFAGDGVPAKDAGLSMPRGLGVDTAGNLYVADSANHRIRLISPSGTITTVAGAGTQTFAGDGTPAVTASLNTPRSVTVSPAGLLTLADTGNQRIRQLDDAPSPGPNIRTLTPGTNVTPEVLTLAGPSTTVYGSGSLTATLASPPATGTVTFLDTTPSGPVSLGSAFLDATGSATISLGALSAGRHTLTASYLGDAIHATAQSSILAITITPLAIDATANPASAVYGQGIPALTGSLIGAFQQDAGKLSVVFACTATVLSPPGVYPITGTLTGSAAPNYTLTAAPANLTITQAPSFTTLSTSTSNSTVGLPLTLTAQLASTTTGVPTGAVTFMDGTSTLATPTLSATGAASFTTNTLALGTHSLTAAYSGDTNFLASTSQVASLIIGTGSDFTLGTSSPTSQSVPAGTSAVFSFAIATQGASLASPINLAVKGLPPGATASFSPATIPPGAGATTSFTLTVQTPYASLSPLHRPTSPVPPAPLFAVIFFPTMLAARVFRGNRRLRRKILLCATVAAFAASLLSGCGNRVNTAPQMTSAVTYTLTVTGTATGSSGAVLEHSATVTLQVL